ncbi:MAG: hypothetical protein ACLFVR_04405 [Thiohalospira sp.]
MKNLSKYQYLGEIPQEYKEYYEASFFGTTRKFYKPQKFIYNNEFIFFVYRPAVKYFLQNFASKYSKENKKKVYEAIIQGYNIGIKEYNNTFDLTKTGAKKLLEEIERLQNSLFKETHVNYAELKQCGEIEGRINCIYGIIDSNKDLFMKDEIKTIQNLTAMQIAAIHYYRYDYPLTNSNIKHFLNEIKYTEPKKTSHIVEQYNLWKSPATRYKKGSQKEETSIQTVYEKIMPFLNEDEAIKAKEDFKIFIDHRNNNK